jgi:hypothetical protein
MMLLNVRLMTAMRCQRSWVVFRSRTLCVSPRLVVAGTCGLVFVGRWQRSRLAGWLLRLGPTTAAWTTGCF